MINKPGWTFNYFSPHTTKLHCEYKFSSVYTKCLMIRGLGDCGSSRVVPFSTKVTISTKQIQNTHTYILINLYSIQYASQTNSCGEKLRNIASSHVYKKKLHLREYIWQVYEVKSFFSPFCANITLTRVLEHAFLYTTHKNS